MQKPHKALLGTSLGLALLSLPALAQQAAPMRPEAMDLPAGRTSTGAAPRAGAGPEQDARLADRLGVTQGPGAWFKEAEDALRRGHLSAANELLERAETRMLSRATPAPMAGQPMQSPALQHSAAARAALATRDRDTAMRQIGMARMAAESSATGASTAPMPMQGGSMDRLDDAGERKGPPGSATRRDQGPGGTSIARANHLSPPSLPAPLVRTQAGQAPANSMGEAQRAAPGQAVPRAASPNTTPPGRSTMPAAPRSGADAPTRSGTGSPTTAPNTAGSSVTGGTPSGGSN